MRRCAICPRRLSVSEKSGCAGLFRQRLKKCLRRGRKLPARPAPEGSASPVGCCRQRRQSDPKVRRKEACAQWREGKRVPCGHLPPEVAKRPGAHRREASALWAVARSAKRPAGVSKYKGCARPARRTPIFAKGREARMIEQPGARNAACGRQRRIPQELCSPRPVRSPAARARSCRGRRVPAPAARAVRPHQPRNPHRASVSSAFMRKKRVSPHPAAHIAGPLARTLPQRFGEPQLSKLKSESSDMRGGFGSLASARQPYAGRRPAKSTAQPLTK